MRTPYGYDDEDNPYPFQHKPRRPRAQHWNPGNSANPDGGAGGDGGDDKNKTANRYIQQAETLALQAKALRAALGKHGFKAALKQKLENVNQAVRQQDDELVREYGDRVGTLAKAATDNDAAAAGSTYANLTNAARERANALSEVAAQGAGESDLLRAQQMSLRNWNQNQSEIQRSYFDTLTSVNSSLTDLTADTRTARINNVIQGNADKEQLHNSYRDQRGETLTQLGNTLGQMAEYYGMANEEHGSKKSRRRRKKVSDASGEAFMDAAEETGKAWDSPGVPGRLSGWPGVSAFKGKGISGGYHQATSSTTDLSAPEGATLRSWA